MAGRSTGAGREAAQVDPIYDAQAAFQPLDVYELAEPVGSMAGFEADALGHIRACPRCGAEDTDTARYCRGCGVGFIGAAPEEEPQRGSPVLAVVIATLLLLALVAGGVFAYRALRPVAPAAPISAAAPAPVVSKVLPSTVSKPAPPAAASPPPAALQPPLKPWPAAPGVVAPAIVDPVWVRRPSPAEVSNLYPELAADEDLEGEAVINCTVTALGALTSCKVAVERPAHHGFGTATLRLASRFRMRPTTRSGEPVAGRSIRVPVRWRLDD
jgi:TonB family protein